MMETISELLKNPIVNLAVAALIGFVANIVANRWIEKSKSIWWGTKSKYLNSFYFDKTGKLRITYRLPTGRSRHIISYLVVNRVVFWSGGKATLQADDLSTQVPLQISLGEESEILEVRPVGQSNPTIRMKKEGKRQLNLEFEYLDRNQGAVFDIVHCGYSDELTFGGVLKGGKITTKALQEAALFASFPFIPQRLRPRTRIAITKWLSSIASVLLLWGLLSISPETLVREVSGFSVGFWLIMKIVIALLFYVWVSVYFWTMPVVPKDLVAFYEGID